MEILPRRKIHTISLSSMVLLVTLIIAIGCTTSNKPEINNPSSSSNTAAPDLIVTHIWCTGAMVIYEVENQGTAESEICTTYLYLNGNHVASSYTQPLLPGEKRRFKFQNYALSYGDIGKGDTEYTDAQLQVLLTLKVCIDAENNLTESNKDNNCLSATPAQYLDLKELFTKTR